MLIEKPTEIKYALVWNDELFDKNENNTWKQLTGVF